MTLIIVALILLIQIPLVAYIYNKNERTTVFISLSSVIALLSALIGSLLMFSENNEKIFYTAVSFSLGMALNNLSVINAKRTRSIGALIIAGSFAIAIVGGGLIGGFSNLFHSWSIGGGNAIYSTSQFAALGLLSLSLTFGSTLFRE